MRAWVSNAKDALLREARGYRPEPSPMVDEPCGAVEPGKPFVATP